MAYVEKYAEVTGGADVSALTPEIAAAFVSGYRELAAGADVSQLTPSEIVAYVSFLRGKGKCGYLRAQTRRRHSLCHGL